MTHFRSVHYARAAAALMVVVFHIHTTTSLMRPDADAVAWLKGGVDIFFVVSGFVMVKATTDKAISPLDFFKRRCQRIIPLYWLATVVTMATIDGEWLFKLGSMLFVPMANPQSGAWQPVVEPGWTLNYEMFFYLLFAISLTIKPKWRFGALGALLAGFAFLSLIAPPKSLVGFYANPIVLEFLFGMMIAKYHIRGSALLVPVGLLAMYLLYPLEVPRLISLGLPAAIIIVGAVGSEAKVGSSRLLTLLGDASYSIYIFHLVALSIFVTYWSKIGLSKVYFVPTAVLFIVVVAVAIHWLLERPIIACFARINTQSAPRRSRNTESSTLSRQNSSAAFKTE